ncbi:MAG: hypothetical protein WC184_13240 [Acidimicrobiia bacterium]
MALNIDQITAQLATVLNQLETRLTNPNIPDNSGVYDSREVAQLAGLLSMLVFHTNYFELNTPPTPQRDSQTIAEFLASQTNLFCAPNPTTRQTATTTLHKQLQQLTNTPPNQHPTV